MASFLRLSLLASASRSASRRASSAFMWSLHHVCTALALTPASLSLRTHAMKCVVVDVDQVAQRGAQGGFHERAFHLHRDGAGGRFDPVVAGHVGTPQSNDEDEQDESLLDDDES